MARREKDDERDDDRDDHNRQNGDPILRWIPAAVGLGGAVTPTLLKDTAWLEHSAFTLLAVVVVLVVHGLLGITVKFVASQEARANRAERQIALIIAALATHETEDVRRASATREAIRDWAESMRDEIQTVPTSTLALVTQVLQPREPISRPDIVPIQTPAARTNGEKP